MSTDATRPTRVADVQDFLAGLCPWSFPEEGVRYGDPDADVRGILVCWMANKRALQRAVDSGCNVVLCHEIPFYGRRGEANERCCLSWPANRVRQALLDEHKLAVVVCHRSMDTFCVARNVQERLELPEPSVVEPMAGYDATRVFDLDPAPLRHYVKRWKQAYGLDHVRVFAPDLDREVRRAGLAWGGIGLYSNLALDARLVELGCDVLIGGETEEYTIEFCGDTDVAFVELGHGTTEAPGMVEGSRAVAAAFPHLRVETFEEWPLVQVV